jgi:hypothetical protein
MTFSNAAFTVTSRRVVETFAEFMKGIALGLFIQRDFGGSKARRRLWE